MIPGTEGHNFQENVCLSIKIKENSMKKKAWTKQEDECLLEQVKHIFRDRDELDEYNKTFLLEKGFPWVNVTRIEPLKKENPINAVNDI